MPEGWIEREVWEEGTFYLYKTWLLVLISNNKISPKILQLYLIWLKFELRVRGGDEEGTFYFYNTSIAVLISNNKISQQQNIILPKEANKNPFEESPFRQFYLKIMVLKW